jgi:hypothetical protein
MGPTVSAVAQHVGPAGSTACDDSTGATRRRALRALHASACLHVKHQGIGEILVQFDILLHLQFASGHCHALAWSLSSSSLHCTARHTML